MHKGSNPFNKMVCYLYSIYINPLDYSLYQNITNAISIEAILHYSENSYKPKENCTSTFRTEKNALKIFSIWGCLNPWRQNSWVRWPPPVRRKQFCSRSVQSAGVTALLGHASLPELTHEVKKTNVFLGLLATAAHSAVSQSAVTHQHSDSAVSSPHWCEPLMWYFLASSVLHFHDLDWDLI